MKRSFRHFCSDFVLRPQKASLTHVLSDYDKLVSRFLKQFIIVLAISSSRITDYSDYYWILSVKLAQH
jgi:hypothetical protein